LNAFYGFKGFYKAFKRSFRGLLNAFKIPFTGLKKEKTFQRPLKSKNAFLKALYGPLKGL
jgi:hypothetical protein